VVFCSDATGWPLDQAGRAVTLAAFYLMLPALAWLVRRYSGEEQAGWLTVVFTLLCPLYIFYARAFLIDPIALTLTLWYLRCFVPAVERGEPRAIIGANLFGLAAGLVKIMTLMLFAVPLAVYFGRRLWRAGIEHGWRQGPVQLLQRWAASSLLPVAGSYAWIRFADAVKAQHPSGRALVSEAMHTYHFGSWSDRFDPGWWSTIYRTVTTHVAPLPTLTIVLVLGVLGLFRRDGKLVALILMFTAGPLIFPRLYSIHEYYFVAAGVFLTAGLGMAVALSAANRDHSPG